MVSDGDDSEAISTRAVDVAVRLTALGLLGAWCFVLLRPFVAIVVWGAILAVALAPIFNWLKRLVGGRGGIAAAILTAAGLALILGPVALLLANLAASVEALRQAVGTGAVEIPPPPPGIADWPWIGPPVNEVWAEASDNLEGVFARYAPQLEQLARIVLAIGAAAGVTIVQFILAMIVAGVLLPNATTVAHGLSRLADRLTPARGRGFVTLAGATVRNVARGVVGIAVLQGLLLGIGFLAAGIPFAGVWAFLCVVLGIVQIGPAVVVIGTLIYAWTTLGTLAALLFTLWIVPMTLLDNVLKPIVMARGLPVPMLVILIGVLGGTLVHGIVGLFVGPVVLAFGYELVRGWVRAETEEPSAT